MGLFAAKAWYLTLLGSLSCIIPYLYLYFRRLGLSEDQIGGLAVLRPWASALAGQLGSGIADVTGKHRAVVMISFVLSVVFRVTLVQWNSYAMIFVWLLVTECLGAPSVGIPDAAIAALCEKGMFGRQRLWGAVGWGTFVFVSGTLISKFGIESIFVSYGTLSVFAFVAGLLLDFSGIKEKHDKHNDAHTEKDSVTGSGVQEDAGDVSTPFIKSSDPSFDASNIEDAMESQDGSSDHALIPVPSQTDGFWQKLGKLLSSVEVVNFIFLAFFMGIGLGTVEGYLILYLDQLGAGEVLMGLAITMTCVAEVPLFMVAPQIIRFFGIMNVFHIVMLTFVVRLTCVATLEWWGSTWMVLLIQPLQGITFGWAYAAGTEYSTQIAPPQLKATVQSIFVGTFCGIGYGTGGLVGGLLYQAFGARVLFLATAGIVAMGWGASSLLMCVASACRRRRSVHN